MRVSNEELQRKLDKDAALLDAEQKKTLSYCSRINNVVQCIKREIEEHPKRHVTLKKAEHA